MNETKRRLYVERDGFWTEASMLFMALAIVFRLIGSIGRWEDTHYLITQVALPVFSGLLFLLCLLLAGQKAFWTTVIPVVLGVVFFIFRIMGVENEWQMVACIALYVVIAVLYALTFSHLGLKWVLAAILALAFLYHVVIEDVPVLMDLENPVSFVDGMQEMSVLGIILSLLCVSLAMKFPAKPAREQQPEPAAQEAPRPTALVWDQAEPTPQQSQEDSPVETVPVQEPSFLAEPAPAFPLEEPPAAEEPPEKDGPEAL